MTSEDVNRTATSLTFNAVTHFLGRLLSIDCPYQSNLFSPIPHECNKNMVRWVDFLKKDNKRKHSYK